MRELTPSTMLGCAIAALAFAPVRPVGTFSRASAVRASVQVAEVADEKLIKAASQKLRKAASSFGKEQKEAAEQWLDKTIATGGFSSAALLQQKTMLFEECTINDDGSSNCMALDEALVDLQDAMTTKESAADATNAKKRLAQNSVNKAALSVRSAASKFGPLQKKQADAWVQRALDGESSSSLIEQSVALFGECELSEEGSKAPNKCAALSKALEELRAALGDVDDLRGVVAPFGKMTDMEYRKFKASEGVTR